MTLLISNAFPSPFFHPPIPFKKVATHSNYVLENILWGLPKSVSLLVYK